MRGAERRALEAKPVHAAVEFEPYFEGDAGSGRAQQFDLFLRVYHQLEAGGRRRVELLAVEDSFEKHRGRRDARLSQYQTFIDPRHGEGVCGVERPRDIDEPMTVGVGLDDGHDARLRRPAPHDLQIVPKRAGVHRRADQGYHRNLTAASPKYALAIGLWREVFELCILAEEGELNVPCRAVALLRDDNVGDALARSIRLVKLFSVDQQNQICVLF